VEFVYRFLKKLIWIYAGMRERISGGWIQKNSSRIREWELMAYAYSKSPIGVIGGLIVFITFILAVIGPMISWEPYWEYKIVINETYRYMPPCLPPLHALAHHYSALMSGVETYLQCHSMV